MHTLVFATLMANHLPVEMAYTDQSGATSGGNAGAATLLAAAVVLVLALRNMRRAVAPVAEVVRAVVAAGFVLVLLVLAIALVLVAAFIHG